MPVELPIINLGGSPKRGQSGASKILDQVSSLLLEPRTVVKKGFKEAGKLVKRRREEISRTKDLSKALDIVGETLSSTLIAGGTVLGAANPVAAGRVAASLVPTSIRGKLVATTGLGVVTTSKKAREILSNFIQDPTKIGREAGFLIDKAVSGKDVGGVIEGLKTAGLIGGGVAATVGAQKIVKNILDRKSTAPADKVINTPSEVPTSVALPFTTVPSALSPISDAPVVATSPKPEVSQPQASVVNVKVINKPQVNVASAQSI